MCIFTVTHGDTYVAVATYAGMKENLGYRISTIIATCFLLKSETVANT